MNRTGHYRLICLALLGLLTGIFPAGSEAPDSAPLSGDLIIFHAGSLSVPFAEIAAAFMQLHPGVRVLREAAGSRACARKIADLGRPCDVFGSADYSVINTLLIPDHARWAIRFASNEMALVYTAKSRCVAELNAQNWPEILLRHAVAYGRSDPNADPCGYRAVLTLKLAERHYGLPGLADRLQAKDQRFIRPKETDLLALLESHSLDYIFLYRSVAEQHYLPYLRLPVEINLESPAYAAAYRAVSVEISGKAPGEYITKQGEPMIYGVTQPLNAPNPAAAVAFIAFLLNPDQGGKILARNGQPLISPAPSKSYAQIPEPLKAFASAP